MNNFIRYLICMGSCWSLTLCLFYSHAQKLEHLTLNCGDVSLKQVAEYISEQTGKNILVDSDVSVQVSVQLTDVPWFDVLILVVQQANCKLIQFSENIWLITRLPLISMEFKNAELSKIISMIATFANINIVCSRDIQGKVSLRFKDVPWEEALQEVITAVDPTFKIFHYRKNILYIVKESHFLILTEAEKNSQKTNTPLSIKRVSLEVNDENVLKTIATLREMTGANIVVDPKISAKVTFTLRDVPWFEILQVIAWQSKCEITPVNEQMWKISKPSTIHFCCKDENLQNALLLFAEIADFSVVCSGSMKEKVSLQLSEVSWSDALETLAYITGYELIMVSSDIFRIRKMQKE